MTDGDADDITCCRMQSGGARCGRFHVFRPNDWATACAH